jgi:hypothetical protein
MVYEDPLDPALDVRFPSPYPSHIGTQLLSCDPPGLARSRERGVGFACPANWFEWLLHPTMDMRGR